MIRHAVPADVPVIGRFIRELAAYERAPGQAVASDADLAAALFGPDPAVHAHVACDDRTGEPAGFALWFLNFSTWRGRHGIYLEDLYVVPDARGHGHGKALLAELARLAAERILVCAVVGARLEPPVDRLLRGAGRGGAGRVDGLPPLG